MNKALQQAAIDDVLAYCRDAQHVMNKGRLLAPVLLECQWGSEANDLDLTTAMEALLGRELGRWRRTLVLPDLAVGDVAGIVAQLRDERTAQHKPFEALSLAWAYYIEQLATAFLAEQLKCSIRSVQLKIEVGRKEVARLVEEQARNAYVQAQPTVPHAVALNGQSPTPQFKEVGGPVPLDDDKPLPASQSSVHQKPRPHSARQPFASRQINQTISGDNVQAVIGPVGGSINQHQTHHHHYGDQHNPQPLRQGDQSLFAAAVLLVIVGGYWLIQTAPWLSVGMLLLLTLWRTGQNGWRALSGEPRGEPDDIAWYVGYALAWFGALAWTVVLARRLSDVPAAAPFSLQQLMLIVLFVSASTYVFWLGTLDIMRWVYHTDNHRWPWRLLTRHATWTWMQRWVLLGLTWLMLIVFTISQIMISQ